jgi:hypothetical protein
MKLNRKPALCTMTDFELNDLLWCAKAEIELPWKMLEIAQTDRDRARAEIEIHKTRILQLEIWLKLDAMLEKRIASGEVQIIGRVSH